MLTKKIKNTPDMELTLLWILRINQDVIKENKDKSSRCLQKISDMRQLKVAGALVNPNGMPVNS